MKVRASEHALRPLASRRRTWFNSDSLLSPIEKAPYYLTVRPTPHTHVAAIQTSAESPELGDQGEASSRASRPTQLPRLAVASRRIPAFIRAVTVTGGKPTHAWRASSFCRVTVTSARL